MSTNFPMDWRKMTKADRRQIRMTSRSFRVPVHMLVTNYPWWRKVTDRRKAYRP